MMSGAKWNRYRIFHHPSQFVLYHPLTATGYWYKCSAMASLAAVLVGKARAARSCAACAVARCLVSAGEPADAVAARSGARSPVWAPCGCSRSSARRSSAHATTRRSLRARTWHWMVVAAEPARSVFSVPSTLRAEAVPVVVVSVLVAVVVRLAVLLSVAALAVLLGRCPAGSLVVVASSVLAWAVAVCSPGAAARSVAWVPAGSALAWGAGRAAECVL